jgi:UDP-3-O-[3-hydroxymyristoyl] glucosamine N-acyltransferase
MKVAEIAERLSARVVGDPEVEILGLAPLDRASGSDLSFLSNPKYRETARVSAAGAILVAEGEHLPGRTLLVCAAPYAAFARALQLFHTPAAHPRGVHPTAVLGEGCRVDPSASVGPYVVLGEGVTIAAGATVEAGCVLGRGSQVGRECHLFPRVVLYEQTLLGDRVILHSGVVVGSDGFGYAQEKGRHLKIPQVGRVVIEHDVEVGANTTIDRGTLDETRIGEGTKIDNLVQVAHNVTTGADCILVAQAGISGSTSLGRSVIFAGQSGAVGHIRVGDGARVGAKSAVTKDVPDGAFVTGHPAVEHRLWLKERALCGRLEEMLKRIKSLEDAPPPEAPKEDEA